MAESDLETFTISQSGMLMWIDQNGFAQASVFCSYEYGFLNGTCQKCSAGKGSLWFQQQGCMTSGLMRTAGITTSQTYQNFVASQVDTLSSSLIAAGICNNPGWEYCYLPPNFQNANATAGNATSDAEKTAPTGLIN